MNVWVLKNWLLIWPLEILIGLIIININNKIVYTVSSCKLIHLHSLFCFLFSEIFFLFERNVADLRVSSESVKFPTKTVITFKPWGDWLWTHVKLSCSGNSTPWLAFLLFNFTPKQHKCRCGVPEWSPQVLSFYVVPPKADSSGFFSVHA